MGGENPHRRPATRNRNGALPGSCFMMPSVRPSIIMPGSFFTTFAILLSDRANVMLNVRDALKGELQVV